ncbi:hypothetical protein AgCh_001497 [Apium graveolens]
MHIRVDSDVSDDTNSDFELKPGPRDQSVLYLQAEHRSTHVWNAGGDTQRSRVRTKLSALHPRLVPILRDLRFDVVARLAGIIIDWGLITALVERWRPETHTFHLPTGECTITLQDVSILLGLRIDGKAVTGHTHSEGGWSDLVKNMFGATPGEQNLKGARLKLTWLHSLTKVLTDDADENELLRYTRAYILQLLGGILFTDHQGCQVHCMFLPLLEDLSSCQKLSWGAGVLAFLYRELCKSSKIGKEEITGCLLLLQLWAWTRLPTLALIPSGPSLDTQDIWGDLAGPYGLRWCGRKSFTDVASRAVCVCRFSLDVLAPDHFIWMPYGDDVLDTLHVHCREGSQFWCYKGPIICFFIVEQHQPDRCVRQFGMCQDIPLAAVKYSKDLHKMTLQGKHDVDWEEKHREHISCWDNRSEHVHVSDCSGVGVTDGYNIWYSDITRPYHTRLASAGSFVIHVLDCISAIARGEVIGGGNRLIDSLATKSRNLLEYQFSHGLCHDFSVDDRRAKEDVLKEKAKAVRVRGGSKRRKMNVQNEGYYHVEEESVRLGDEEGHLVDPGAEKLVDEAGNEDNTETRNFDISPPSSHPTFDLLAASGFNVPPTQQLIFRPPPVQQVPLEQPLEEMEEVVVEEESVVEQPIEQQEVQVPMVEQREAVPEEHHMRLRTRNRHPPGCGTDGVKKVPEVKNRYQRQRKK